MISWCVSWVVLQRFGGLVALREQMTRRAFLALRVIQRQGKSSFNMLVKKWEKIDDENESWSLSSLRVLIICNSAAKEIGSEKRPLFLKLSNSLFNLIAARSQFSYKTQLFFNNSENHRKSSFRTRLQKAFKIISKTPENWKSLVFFKTLVNSETLAKTDRILTFLLLVKIHLEKSIFFCCRTSAVGRLMRLKCVARLRWL